MVETFGSHYVSLHVRVSNQAAIHLYRDTLKFKTEKTELKYYADGEDAFCMKLELAAIREQVREAAIADGGDAEAKSGAKSVTGSEPVAADVDEGEAVGDVGRDPSKKKESEKGVDKEKVKVKVGRGLGVGELVEKNEAKQ